MCEIEEMPIATQDFNRDAKVEMMSTSLNGANQETVQEIPSKPVFALKNKRRFFGEKNDTSKRSTRCPNSIEEGEMVIEQE